MKVVITGGAGFLGKKLARRILQQGEIATEAGQPKKVNELLLFVREYSVREQRNFILGAIDEYRGDESVRDDMTLLGLRI